MRKAEWMLPLKIQLTKSLSLFGPNNEIEGNLASKTKFISNIPRFGPENSDFFTDFDEKFAIVL